MIRLPRDKFPVGSCVKDRKTGDVGTVIHHFFDKTIRDVVVVRWFGRAEGVAEPVESLALFWPAKHKRRQP
jgi:hypothetical protein